MGAVGSTMVERNIKLKRVYVEPDPLDGYRILVDRLWPRGITKLDARVDAWWKQCAPSAALRQWFGHDPKKWPSFQRKYAAELDANPRELHSLLGSVPLQGAITLVYGAKDEKHNNAVVLRQYIRTHFSR